MKETFWKTTEEVVRPDGEIGTGQDRTGQDETGQDRTGQDRTVQDKTERDRPVVVKLCRC
jgi:hypothetical protein